MRTPLRTLVFAYVASGAAALAAGFGTAATLAIFWIGGAVTALVLSAGVAALKPSPAEAARDEEDAASLRHWEAERLAHKEISAARRRCD